MDPLGLVRFALVLALVVILPGVLLVGALFPAPRSTLTRLERSYLSLAGGILLLMLVGLILGFLPAGERGHFRTLATGAPNVELAVLAVSALLFWVGLVRGAYPRIAARFPRLAQPDARGERV